MTVRERPWWGSLTRRLTTEPLGSLAAAYELPIEELEAALAAETGSGSLVLAPWWPEAVRRVRAGVAIREIARRFGSNPRRIRRALARDFVRIQGENTGGPLPEPVRAVRDRLGKQADEDLAVEVGLPGEAIQGARRFFGIPPCVPPPRPRTRVRRVPERARESRPPRREMERPAPKRSNRARPWEEPPPEVIRRSSPPTRPLVNLRRRLVVVPEAEAAAQPLPPEASLAPEPVVAAPPAPIVEALPEPTPVLSPFSDDRGGDEGPSISRLRRGRLRLVRPDLVDEEMDQEEPRPMVRRRKISPHSTVRTLSASELQRDPTGGGPEPLPSSTRESVVEPAQVAPPRLIASAPAAPEPAPSPRPSAAAAEERSRPAPASTPPVARPTRSIAAPPRATPASARPTPPAPAMPDPVPVPVAVPEVTAPRQAVGAIGWRVAVRGEALPFVIVAQDLAEALEILVAKAPGTRVGEASIWSMGPILQDQAK